MGSRVHLVSVAVLLCVAVAAPAYATMPGSNGKISFTHDNDIWVINPDGTGEQQLTDTSSIWEGYYDWSPDGTKIAYDTGGDIHTINADGTGDTTIVDNTYPINDREPSWSPDGTRLAVGRSISSTTGPTVFEIWVVNTDGSDAHQVPTSTNQSGTPQWNPDGRIGFFGCNRPSDGFCSPMPRIVNEDGTGEQALAPWGVNPVAVWGSFSPDGTKVAYQDIPPGLFYPYHEIYVQNLDGTGQMRLTSNFEVDREPAWSPDGTKVVFRSGRGGNGPRIFTMNVDGTDVTQLTDTAGLEPQWQPIHVSTYPRPKGATPLLVYLVPAYARCNAPNEQHGPPLAFGSCSLPAQVSSALTVGTGDANGKPAKSVSTVLIESVPGAPATPADEADVRVTVNVNDVYVQGSLADYAGSLSVHTPLRITDKLNSGPGVAATVSDTSLDVPASCAPTADTTVGATCAVQTTIDTLIPGAVAEGKRSIWELGQVEVDDANGAPFMKQGVFVP